MRRRGLHLAAWRVPDQRMTGKVLRPPLRRGFAGTRSRCVVPPAAGASPNLRRSFLPTAAPVAPISRCRRERGVYRFGIGYLERGKLGKVRHLGRRVTLPLNLNLGEVRVRKIGEGSGHCCRHPWMRKLPESDTLSARSVWKRTGSFGSGRSFARIAGGAT